MLNSSYFYHRSIRKLVVAFGSIFNDIEIVRFTDTGELKERFKVILWCLDNSLINCKLETSLDGVNQRFSNCESTFIDEIQSGSGALGIIENKINVIRSDE